jgi:hypothetical protein
MVRAAVDDELSKEAARRFNITRKTAANGSNVSASKEDVRP